MRLLHNSILQNFAFAFYRDGRGLHMGTMLRDVFEAQAEKYLLWVPVALAVGIGLYFLLPFEPKLLWALCALLVMVSINAVQFLQGRYLFGLVILFSLSLPLLGFSSATFGTLYYGTPMIEREVGPVSLSGTVKALELLDQKNDVRILLSNLRVEGIPIQETPRRVRLRFRNAPKDIEAGQRIKVLAKLMPNSAPLIPGGFDFRRHFFFQGIGAVGFVFRMDNEGEALLPSDADARHDSKRSDLAESLRNTIASKVHMALPEDQANIVEALIIGRRAGIPDPTYDDLRHAGLAHLLAISGLHIGLVAGALFFFVRLGLACSERMALYYPIKKYAAVVAIIGAFIYMVLAGAPIPTQRAMIMTAIIFGAILIDRWPFSLRAVAVAAFIILLIAPHSLLSVSFQLSFAAVTVLVAASEFMLSRWQSLKSRRGVVKRIVLYFGGVAMTSLLAAIATAPFALYHFQQLAMLGILANMAAIPIMAFWIMPCGIVAMLLMPFGLEGMALQIMGAGVQWVTQIAEFVSGMDLSVYHMPQFSFRAFVFIVLAGISFIIFLSHIRRFFVCAFALLALLSFQMQTYSILIARDFDLIGLAQSHAGDGTLVLSSLRREKFTADIWANALNLSVDTQRTLWEMGGMSCDSDGCRYVLHGLRLAFPRSDYALTSDCRWADLVFADFYAERECSSQVDMIDRRTLWRSGAIGIRINEALEKSYEIDYARNTAKRPWSD